MVVGGSVTSKLNFSNSAAGSLVLTVQPAGGGARGPNTIQSYLQHSDTHFDEGRQWSSENTAGEFTHTKILEA